MLGRRIFGPLRSGVYQVRYIGRAGMPYSRTYINTYEHLSTNVHTTDQQSLPLVSGPERGSTVPTTDQLSHTMIPCPQH